MSVSTILLAPLLIVGIALLGSWWFSERVSRRVEREVPPLGRFVKIDGARLHVRDSADGDPGSRERPPLVLIHGLGGNLRNFTHSLTPLLDGEFRTIAIDRLGSGYSTRPGGGGASLAEHAAMIARLIERLDLDRPVVVGHSMGGAVALRLAYDHPTCTRGLVLVAPLAGDVEGVPAMFRPLFIRSDAARRFLSRTVSTPLGMWRGQRTLATVFYPDPVPDDFVVRGGGALGMRRDIFRNTSMDLVGLHEGRSDVAKLSGPLCVPVAIVHGTGDVILDHETHAVRAGALLGAEVELLKGRGHMIPITAANEVAAFVASHARRWFEREAAESA